jgi:hypothetical protein
MQSKIERMKKGGRYSPDEPHPFVVKPTDTVEHGGTVAQSAICGLCDQRADHPMHGGGYASQEPIRAMHGPFGQ